MAGEQKLRPENFDQVLSQLDMDEVGIYADLGLGTPNLTTQMFKRYDCDILLFSVNSIGRFDPELDPELQKYLGRLKKRGVDMSRVTVAKGDMRIQKVDVLSTIGSFGDRYLMKYCLPWLNVLLHSKTRWLTDLKIGSGAYEIARQFGDIYTVARFEEDDSLIARCVISRETLMNDSEKSMQEWQTKIEELTGDDGFYRAQGEHSFIFIKRSDTLVVTFDNLDVAINNRTDRLPWGFSFIEKQNYSMLGVMANAWTWYRDPWVISEFQRLRDEGFFDQFKRVIFYGASMGGYAALAFSPAAKNAHVIAFSPQSTLDKSVVPWEKRYKAGWGGDYSGEFGDAAQTAKSAESVYLFYDPYQELDAGHAKRITGENVHHFRARLMGHKVGTNLLRMGVLQQIVGAAMRDELDNHSFRQYMQARKKLRRYILELYKRAQSKNHLRFALIICQYWLKDNPDDHRFVQWEKELRAALEDAGNQPSPSSSS